MDALIKLLLIIFLSFGSNSISTFRALAPEICDNGLDDDNGGQIDLNDEECHCQPLEQPSLIPNASFEEQDCCPDHHSSIECASGWIRASEGTPDFFHACDYDGTDIFDLPQPLPDGEGFIGIIDGAFTGNYIPGLKEYVGICLEAPLEIDTLYRLEFYTGFLDRSTSPDIEIALFGTNDCTNLPFGMGDKSFGCPSNSPDWVLLGSAKVSGENQWVKSQFKVRPDQEITAVAFGPACHLRSATNNDYHFLDQLVLKKVSDFDLGIKASGQPCSQSMALAVRPQEGYTYQWYKNGIAIPQAVNNSLQTPPGPGQYQVRLGNDEGCKVSKAYTYAPPSQFVLSKQTICAGERLNFNNQQISSAGIYWDTLATRYNCDSIVKLNLEVSQAVETNISAKIFSDESFHIGPYAISSAGEHVRTLSTTSGCDSTVHLQLEHYAVFVPNAFSPNGDYVNDIFSIYGDSDLVEITSLRILNRWGALVYEGKTLHFGQGWNGMISGRKAPTGVYVYTAELLMSDHKARILPGMLTLVR